MTLCVFLKRVMYVMYVMYAVYVMYVMYIVCMCMHAWADGRTDGWLFDVVCMSGCKSYNFQATFKHSGQSLPKLFFIDGTEC